MCPHHLTPHGYAGLPQLSCAGSPAPARSRPGRSCGASCNSSLSLVSGLAGQDLGIRLFPSLSQLFLERHRLVDGLLLMCHVSAATENANAGKSSDLREKSISDLRLIAVSFSDLSSASYFRHHCRPRLICSVHSACPRHEWR